MAHLLSAKEIFVSPTGNDKGEGTLKSPYATFSKALTETKKFAGKEAVNVWFTEGVYHLDKTLEIGHEYAGTAKFPVVFSAMSGAKVTIKGSKRLDNVQWRTYKEGIYVASMPAGLQFDQLFINDERQVRARFPNYDIQNPLRGGNGYQLVINGSNHRYDTWFSFNPKTFSDKAWKNPETGIVHAFQSHNWGNMQYRIKDLNRAENKISLSEGGWQLQRNYGIGKGSSFFIDNIFEELDVAGEWFLDASANLLYYYPKEGVTLKDAKIEVPILKDLIILRGAKETPVKNIQFKGLHFTHSNMTFMDTYEPVARGDWAIHRGGAVFMEGAENCLIEDCRFEYLGGNGVFMSNYNRNNQVKGCQFVHTGESAVCFVGSPSAVRFYQTWDDKEIKGKDWNEMRKNMDLTPGPKTPDYPKDCVVENCIMHDFGDVGKQVAGVYISMSHKIRVSHNTIYNCPRAGICINDGTWGGHIIEHCDIWETVRETGEHGPFNAWGRERQWKGSRGSDADFIKELTQLDAIDTVILRNNRIANFRKSISAGNWTIDLDDGASYFEIYNNLNLGSTIKLRDGMARKVYNNITVSAVPLGWHVWPKESQDEIYQNIFVISGAVPGKAEPTNQFIRQVSLPKDSKWSNHYDNNLYWNVNGLDTSYIYENVTMKEWQQRGHDVHSLTADPLFIDPKKGDYGLKQNSPALKLGFKNFPMNEFGHQMTRITPFGGDFSEKITVEITADKRITEGGKIFYTTDGSEPNIHSKEYKKAILFQESTLLKAQTFDVKGVPIGFVSETYFNKVDTVSYPNWYSTLMAGKFITTDKEKSKKALEMEIEGAILINIADDPDLIDATGGYNFGCYIKSLDPIKAKMWTDSQLEKDWVIQQVNGKKVQGIGQLQAYFKQFKGQKVTLTAARDYNTRKFEVKIP